MRGFLTAALFASAIAAQAAAAVDDCPECVLGLWDNPGLTRNFGTIAVGTPKTIYLGIDIADRTAALLGIEFSIAGIRHVEDGILLLGLSAVPPTMMVGGPWAPADTSETTTGTGGMNLAWSGCQREAQVLAVITLQALIPQTNKVLRVLRRYPPTRPEFRRPCFFQCDAPHYTPTLVRGGCYILNWDGVSDPGCNTAVAVESTTWSGMKALFR